MCKKKYILISIFFTLCLIVFADNKNDANNSELKLFFVKISKVLPEDIVNKISSNRSLFFKDLNLLLDSEKEDLLILVDKEHLISKNFKPLKIITLNNIKSRSYRLNKENLQLSSLAVDSLEKMAKAAKKDSVILLVSSAYRSYNYQKNLFKRYSKIYGEKKASQFSAKPGSSQHQLGTTIDFGSIDDSFAKTTQGKWLFKNAWKYGWSLSYPKGLDDVTGYKWESWHYRYIGVDACKMQKKWFSDVQQYMLEFIHEWKKSGIEL